MSISKITDDLSSILPERNLQPGRQNARNKALEDEAAKIKARQDAKEVARIKAIEKAKLRNEEKKQAKAQELGVELQKGQTLFQAEKIAEQKAKIEVLEQIEEDIKSPLHPVVLAEKRQPYSSAVGVALQVQGTTRPEVLKLLTSLNINLNLQLTKQDTMNLLACLLTCNESQLLALMSNKKVPVVIKTVIKRLIEDMKLGNIDTVERLWDRIFGKGAMCVNIPDQMQTETGIIPNTPVSREAYIVIRDTLMGK